MSHFKRSLVISSFGAFNILIFDNLENGISLISVFINLGILIVAMLALNSWKKQLHYEKKLKIIDELLAILDEAKIEMKQVLHPLNTTNPKSTELSDSLSKNLAPIINRLLKIKPKFLRLYGLEYEKIFRIPSDFRRSIEMIEYKIGIGTKLQEDLSEEFNLNNKIGYSNKKLIENSNKYLSDVNKEMEKRYLDNYDVENNEFVKKISMAIEKVEQILEN